MIQSWSLREEIFIATHRWPLPLLAFLLGALVGVASTAVLPTPFRAEYAMNVAFSGDLILRNSDDYKNGQMGMLNTYIVSKDILDEVLTRLRKRDPYWNGVSVKELKPKLHVYWRNVGKWRFVAEEKNPVRASQLANTWGEVVQEMVANAVFHADWELRMRTQLDTNSYQQTDVQMRVAELKQIQEALWSWRKAADQTSSQQSPDQMERWRLQSLIAQGVRLDPLGKELLDQMPPPDAKIQDYIPWVDRSIVYLGEELSTANQSLNILQNQSNDIAKALDDALKASHGLTAHLRLEPLPLEKVEATQVRTKTELALVGGLVGLLAWGLIWLGIPVLKAKK